MHVSTDILIGISIFFTFFIIFLDSLIFFKLVSFHIF